jgi:hypothetical protein
MISRLTTAAAIFAVLATSTIAWAATTQTQHRSAAACDMTVVQLPLVQVTGKRTASAPTVAQR